MPTTINEVNCVKTLLGTGLADCVLRKDKITSVIKVKPGWTFNPATETFDLAYVISKVQDGTFAPFLNTVDFTNNTPESNIKEYGDHSKAVVNNGKPEYSLEFDNGVFWHAAASSYSGFRNGGVIEIDKQGTVWLNRNVAGTILSAFETNMFNVPTYTPVINDEPAKTFIMYQIRNEVAFNTRMTAISLSQIGADLNDELKGFLSVTITGTATAGDPILIQVDDMGSNYGIEALEVSNFRVINDDTNAVLALTSATPGATPGSYVLTPTVPLVAAAHIKVMTYDAAAGVPTALLPDSNLMYRGESLVIIVGA